ncbi:MAG TPA: spondin domain-containing protein [Tepidisphaeraceae bacterium]|nr:spondin domain-containing protein [Tepidisphaeraceae bacterium]
MKKLAFLSVGVIVGLSTGASAVVVPVQVTVENLAPANSISFAPLRFGFGNGTFDSFDNNAVAFLLGFPTIADAPIVTIAEGGSGANWFPAFQAAEPNANLGTVTGPGGPILPGQTNSATFMIDTSNRFFTFGSMVVPSNDHFIGNANPQQYEVFDGSGNLVLASILQRGSQIWDAGSETQNPANAAFLVGGVNDQRENENNPVTFNFSNLNAFNGLQTAPGYIFDSGLITGNSDVFRISFTVVPEPATAGLFAGTAGLLALRRRRA